MGPHYEAFGLPLTSLVPRSDPRGPGPRPKVLKRHQTIPKGAQMEPRVARLELRELPKCQKDAKLHPKGGKMEAQVPKWSAKVTQSPLSPGPIGTLRELCIPYERGVEVHEKR